MIEDPFVSFVSYKVLKGTSVLVRREIWISAETTVSN